MKHLTTLALIAGVCTVVGLFLSSGLTDVWAAVLSAGWGALAVIVARFLAVAWAGLGWFVVFPSRERPSLKDCITLRFVREGINTLLPVAQVGGDFVGARLLAKRGISGSLAGASMFVDLMTQALTQLLFTIAGLGILIWLAGDGPVVRAVSGGLALAVPALGAFYLIQRRSGHRLIQAALTRFASGREWRALGAVDVLYANLKRLYGNGARFGNAVFVHLLGWVIGTFEVYICLHFMGYPVSFFEAIVIESLAQAVRGAAFAVPGALGAQEGGLIALCAIFGIPTEAALALSLVKRAADLAIGLPSLVLWHRLEGRARKEAQPVTTPETNQDGFRDRIIGRSFEPPPRVPAYGYAANVPVHSRPVDIERGELKKCA
ncbi:HpnL family protein [Methylobacterium haplocladii]|uniref:TIGR00374 family protein n=1 Tax=Methylobacterium haplocladii TaxID=1176176 RepID=A0A512IVI1_9HYPH|nr:HpnL family protein [Methylobacterium haplocladii]GEP01720.1 hypothetical protein MHA02_41070 [Methylobacterium haplocladii]GJD85317.1 hypothetical protein HPGCJGGD_3205 [Methylobacterium haplocladii]GLS59386.1 hypothetical protein GCM10007887_20520 [Methylobacterium haplocladii]